MARSSNWRNLAICGHASAGKTTLVDRLLAASGAVSGTPDVTDQSSICDFDETSLLLWDGQIVPGSIP